MSRSASPLAQQVTAKFAEAKAAGAVIFADSHLAIVEVGNLPIQLRYCPSLAKKPGKAAADGPVEKVKEKKKFDPFEDPADELLVARRLPTANHPQPLPPTHNIVLNKFPIIANHFILATSENKPQTHLLEADDLFQTYLCLTEWSAKNTGHEDRLFAFFNSGDHSGASQPHRHLQFLPVNDMRGTCSNEKWNLLLDAIHEAPTLKGTSSVYPLHALLSLPFVHASIHLPPFSDAATLTDIYLRLYTFAATAVREWIEDHDDLTLHDTSQGDLPISYNLAMTTECMLIAPRRAEGLVVTRKDGSEVDAVALNGTFLGGTMMVKNEEVYGILQQRPEWIEEVFAAVGVPWSEAMERITEAALANTVFPELNASRVPSHNL